jgi:hypothetical protein
MYSMYARVQPSSGFLLGTRDANTGHHFVSLKGVYVRRPVAEGGNSSRSFLAIASNRALRSLFVWCPLFGPRKALWVDNNNGEIQGTRYSFSSNVAVSFAVSFSAFLG